MKIPEIVGFLLQKHQDEIHSILELADSKSAKEATSF